MAHTMAKAGVRRMGSRVAVQARFGRGAPGRRGQASVATRLGREAQALRASGGPGSQATDDVLRIADVKSKATELQLTRSGGHARAGG